MYLSLMHIAAFEREFTLEYNYNLINATGLWHSAEEEMTKCYF